MAEAQSDIAIICLIILCTPLVMVGLYKYVAFISNLVHKYGYKDEAMNCGMTFLMVGAPLIWLLGGFMVYVMIRDYGLCFLWVLVCLIIAFITIWILVDHDHL